LERKASVRLPIRRTHPVQPLATFWCCPARLDGMRLASKPHVRCSECVASALKENPMPGLTWLRPIWRAFADALRDGLLARADARACWHAQPSGRSGKKT